MACCEDCDKQFVSSKALQQHIRDSPAHAATFDCDECDRTFDSEGALQQHIRDSPAHAATFDCDECDRTFDSEGALQQHTRDSPAHAATFDCVECDRSFGSDEALEQHARDSPRHLRRLTPLDDFFASFPTFAYDRKLPPAISYRLLRQYYGWQKEDRESEMAWNDYQDAMQAEVRLWFGDEDSLVAWHTLCRAIGIRPLPDTQQACAKAVRNTHVNIVDLIEWGRNGSLSGSRVQIFGSVEELRDYSQSTGKIFRNTFQEHDGESNVVLRHLLRKIFRVSL